MPAAPRRLTAGCAIVALALAPRAASAHVKWFSDFSFRDPPLPLSAVLTPTFWALLALSVVALGALVLLGKRLEGAAWYVRISEWLAGYGDRSLLVLRVAAGAVMLLNWQADVLLAPELSGAGAWAGWAQFAVACLLLFRQTTPLAGAALLAPELSGAGAWAGWAQFAVACLLLFRQTTPLAGAAMLALVSVAVARFGAFHMLDYAYLVGFGVAFAVSGARSERLRGLGLPALFATVGFSLFWVALEKLVYPEWGLYVLQQNPALTLGFPVLFFLTAAAFVELALGYLLLIGLLERPLALVITLVFFTTTLIFGKLEVIGHTMIHAALIVFLIEGTGALYTPPARFHRQTPLRVAFASVNFAVLLGLLLVPYVWGAARVHERAMRAETPTHVHALGEAPAHE